jgi:predicted hotdog family 3-hydroxylacyl-ACP dehydratase
MVFCCGAVLCWQAIGSHSASRSSALQKKALTPGGLAGNEGLSSLLHVHQVAALEQETISFQKKRKAAEQTRL